MSDEKKDAESQKVLAAYEKYINQGYARHTAMYMAMKEVKGK